LYQYGINNEGTVDTRFQMTWIRISYRNTGSSIYRISTISRICTSYKYLLECDFVQYTNKIIHYSSRDILSLFFVEINIKYFPDYRFGIELHCVLFFYLKYGHWKSI